MKKEIDLVELLSLDWLYAFEVAQEPYAPTITTNDVRRIVALSNGKKDVRSWLGVFEMKDGSYISLRASCEKEGWWGEEAFGYILAGKNEEEIISSLRRPERDRLGL